MVVTERRGGKLRRLLERGATALQGGLSEGREIDGNCRQERVS
jgi:hypothetical protein